MFRRGGQQGQRIPPAAGPVVEVGDVQVALCSERVADSVGESLFVRLASAQQVAFPRGEVVQRIDLLQAVERGLRSGSGRGGCTGYGGRIGC